MKYKQHSNDVSKTSQDSKTDYFATIDLEIAKALKLPLRAQIWIIFAGLYRSTLPADPKLKSGHVLHCGNQFLMAQTGAKSIQQIRNAVADLKRSGVIQIGGSQRDRTIKPLYRDIEGLHKLSECNKSNDTQSTECNENGYTQKTSVTKNQRECNRSCVTQGSECHRIDDHKKDLLEKSREREGTTQKPDPTSSADLSSPPNFKNPVLDSQQSEAESRSAKQLSADELISLADDAARKPEAGKDFQPHKWLINEADATLDHCSITWWKDQRFIEEGQRPLKGLHRIWMSPKQVDHVIAFYKAEFGDRWKACLKQGLSKVAAQEARNAPHGEKSSKHEPYVVLTTWKHLDLKSALKKGATFANGISAEKTQEQLRQDSIRKTQAQKEAIKQREQESLKDEHAILKAKAKGMFELARSSNLSTRKAAQDWLQEHGYIDMKGADQMCETPQKICEEQSRERIAMATYGSVLGELH